MLVCADARRIPLADESVQCVVTSPPYWGLRKYAGEQELVWGGREDCQHKWTEVFKPGISGGLHGMIAGYEPHRFVPASKHGTCAVCGAWRGAYGLEPTVEMYVQHTVEILREIRRVLRKDGVCFWNIGDSYAASGGNERYFGKQFKSDKQGQVSSQWGSVKHPTKPKDLCLIPQRVALAAQADGWWVRSDIIWHKPNPMPESCKDRPTDAYEHILMLTKSAKYYWDAEAVAEESADPIGTKKRYGSEFRRVMVSAMDGDNKYRIAVEGTREFNGKRNLRNVWQFATQPYKGAHFATFPGELPDRCIRAATKRGDLVLDPFAGSGTTGRVAIALGRRAVLLDLAYTHDYKPLAAERTSKVQIELLG